jgi:hypothetical protein
MAGYRAAGQQAYVRQTVQPPMLEVPACCACVPPGEIMNLQQPGGDVFVLSWDPVSNATYYTVTTESTALTIDYPDNTATTAALNWTEGEIALITVRAYNSCGSSQAELNAAPCFLAGSLVTLADGSTKVIEDIEIGDVVLGAFGEANPVLALHRPLLGTHQMCRINEEHSTTSHHPHISADAKFYCVHPSVTDNTTYGREHTVITTNGEELMMLHGLKRGRIQVLETGIHLKTVEGSRETKSLELYSLPADTQLYNLVVGGSHTYHVDGYAVTGWPREDDFNYDTWTQA